MTSRNLLLAAFLGCFCSASSLAPAASINSPAALNAGSSKIDFESPAYPSGASSPITDGFATVTVSIGTVQPLNYTQNPGIFDGQWLVGGGDYVIEFSQPVAEFGMGIFDANLAGNVLRVLNGSNVELERLTSVTDAHFPVGPTGGVFSSFAGFKRAANDIKRVELLLVGDYIGIDNITYFVTDQAPASAPEPAAFGLALAALFTFVITGGARCLRTRVLRNRVQN